MSDKPHIMPRYDCPPGNVYVDPDLRIICSPGQLRLAFKAAVDLWNERLADELRHVLQAIERGDVTIDPVGETADQIYAGNVTYETSNGWTIVVFNDCNCWDYLDSVITPDGRKAEYPSGFETDAERDDLYQLFVSYSPPDDVIRDVYGFTRCHPCCRVD